MDGVSKVIHNELQRAKAIQELVEREFPFQVQLKKPAPPGTRSMKKTWRMWMEETAQWMAERGATMPLYYRPNGEPVGKRPFNKDDAHEAFMRLWGGTLDNGDREHQEHVDKGTLLYIMDKHLHWAAEKGIALTIPKDGEYQRLTKMTEET